MTITILSRLFRFRLSVAIAVTALTGHVYYCNSVTPGAGVVFAGVLLLSMAASVLNQFQERNYDSLMERTRSRPVPLHQIATGTAIILFCILFLLGVFLLFVFATSHAALLGIFTLVWYNAVYTPLKRKTPLAFVAGALTGATPPMIGYISAGGHIDCKILVISSFMFLWQIPHFLFLLFRYAKEYEKAGFPTLFTVLSESSIRLILLTSMIITVGSTMLFPLCGVVHSLLIINILFGVNALFLVYFSIALCLKKADATTCTLPRLMYPYQGIILIVLLVQALSL